MLPLKKTWLYPAIAGIVLLASGCANNAAPNYTHPNKTMSNQSAPHVRNFDGVHVRNYDGMRSTNIDGYHHTRNYTGAGTTSLDGLHVRNYDGTRDGLHVRNGMGLTNNAGNNYGAYPNGTYPHVNNYNAYTSGMRPYNAFTDHKAGMGTTGVYNAPTGTNHSIYQQHGTNRGGAGVMQTGMPHMGYVQTDRQHMRTASVTNVYVDREALAKAVGNVTASCPGVQRSTVLVTDKEVFVGLHTQGADARTAKKQARMNAESVSPRYYKVYVTDNPNDIQEIARVASRSSNVSTARTEDARSIDTLVKRMGGTSHNVKTTTSR
ncbi:YhcN/YlaJ family sporulation lipoprotein [Brevibacillus sp. RS1.1]|uniref:YhcN/YlaJ family sporulation lipoprotein n=1 Tax=Brevibacillus sp. RS1.1 TaxID=2738982 RepID=UPI00156ACCB0|nr:YhcN/YlaJ family sporulation lipoprotein [Brevibacillus sp. RS1.1]NRR04154.1 YhcN/YlaJ family sporulation lipoprotein [Brevibacillus sp. RS1.1]